MVEPHCSNFRINTAIFRVSEFLGVLRNYVRVSRIYNFHAISSCHLKMMYHSVLKETVIVGAKFFSFEAITDADSQYI